MTAPWDDKAAKLQQSVRLDERKVPVQYGEGEVNQAVIHAREDVVLAVSHLSSANEQLAKINSYLASIRWILVLIFLLLLAIAYRTVH